MAKQKIELPLIADPSEASADHALCGKCALHTTCNKPFMPAWVPQGWTGKYVGVGEAPGGNEDQMGRPFVGRAGKELYNLLEGAGIVSNDLALTNANRCRPVNNAKPTIRQIRLC